MLRHAAYPTRLPPPGQARGNYQAFERPLGAIDSLKALRSFKVTSAKLKPDASRTRGRLSVHTQNVASIAFANAELDTVDLSAKCRTLSRYDFLDAAERAV